MDRIPILDSTNINSVCYYEDTETLEIEFHNGYVYQYFDVPESFYTNLLGAGSRGKYFSENIKGRFRYARI
jgi:hypothetical protein